MSLNETRSARYREEFDGSEKAARYDASEYAATSWSTLLWQLEQERLERILGDPTFVPRRERFLDFACGSGRVTEFFAPRFSETVGVDISAAMVDRASRRVSQARFLAADVFTEPEVAGGSFDLVTSFRFVLNAERADRLPALRWMRGRLRDDASRAIVNNHSNLWTHKAMTHGIRRLRRRGGSATGNVLSHRQVSRLVRDAGFDIESVHGMGHIGGHALRVVPFETMLRLQRTAAGAPGVQRLGENQIYVLAPR